MKGNKDMYIISLAAAFMAGMVFVPVVLFVYLWISDIHDDFLEGERDL
jgi:hypothetical protein